MSPPLAAPRPGRIRSKSHECRWGTCHSGPSIGRSSLPIHYRETCRSAPPPRLSSWGCVPHLPGLGWGAGQGGHCPGARSGPEVTFNPVLSAYRASRTGALDPSPHVSYLKGQVEAEAWGGGPSSFSLPPPPPPLLFLLPLFLSTSSSSSSPELLGQRSLRGRCRLPSGGHFRNSGA